MRVGVGGCSDRLLCTALLTLPGRVQHLSARWNLAVQLACTMCWRLVQAGFCVVPGACMASRNTCPVVDARWTERFQFDTHNLKQSVVDPLC
jgi:hypothetical protein